jgi:hypothetical protein
LTAADGNRFRFITGIGDNATKMQGQNLTNPASDGYICDKSNQGLYATNYSKNDGGNWLVFTPQIPTAIDSVNVEANDPVVSSAYYNLQGIRIIQPIRGNIYIRVDTHASKKTTATKIFLAQ